MWRVCRADKSAVLVVSSVKVRMEAQHISPMRLCYLLWESFTFTFDYNGKKEFNTYLSQHELIE